jgi:hypothetical protein
MMHRLAPWLRKGAIAVAALAVLAGAPLRAHASSLVAVYEKSGFEYLVNIGDSSSLSGTVAFDANIPEFGGSTAGATFAVVGVVDRNKLDSLLLPVANIVYTNPGSGSPDDGGITTAQLKVAGFGTSDSWFDLIPTIAAGAVGSHVTLQATADNSFEKKVDNTFFGAFPFSIAGTIANDGTLHISLYSGIASDAFDNTPTTLSKLHDLNVFSGGITVPEPTSLVLIGGALASAALLRRRSV